MHHSFEVMFQRRSRQNFNSLSFVEHNQGCWSGCFAWILNEARVRIRILPTGQIRILLTLSLHVRFCQRILNGWGLGDSFPKTYVKNGIRRIPYLHICYQCKFRPENIFMIFQEVPCRGRLKFFFEKRAKNYRQGVQCFLVINTHIKKPSKFEFFLFCNKKITTQINLHFPTKNINSFCWV